jgi:hypothetical protein
LHTMNIAKSFCVPRLQRFIVLFGFILSGSAVVFLFAAYGLAQEQAAPLLVMISVDGMRPDYSTEADKHMRDVAQTLAHEMALLLQRLSAGRLILLRNRLVWRSRNQRHL